MCIIRREDLSFYVEGIEENVIDILKDKNNIEVEPNSWVVKRLVDLIVEKVESSYGDGVGDGYREAKEYQEAEEEREGPNSCLRERGEVDPPLSS